MHGRECCLWDSKDSGALETLDTAICGLFRVRPLEQPHHSPELEYVPTNHSSAGRLSHKVHSRSGPALFVYGKRGQHRQKKHTEYRCACCKSRGGP